MASSTACATVLIRRHLARPIHVPQHRVLFSHSAVTATAAAAASSATSSSSSSTMPSLPDQPPIVVPSDPSSVLRAPGSGSTPAPRPTAASTPAPKKRARPTIRATKAALSISQTAVDRLKGLSSGPTPQLIRIGVRNKGCAGMSYHLDYVDRPDKFDEVVEQDGVRVLIESKALMSIIGSEMDWQEDQLSSKFIFNNPNIKDACGCGESFTTN